jgi:hypothetical protein
LVGFPARIRHQTHFYLSTAAINTLHVFYQGGKPLGHVTSGSPSGNEKFVGLKGQADGNAKAFFLDGRDGKMNVNHEFIGKWTCRIFG